VRGGEAVGGVGGVRGEEAEVEAEDECREAGGGSEFGRKGDGSETRQPMPADLCVGRA
jgi:hypothetical protein